METPWEHSYSVVKGLCCHDNNCCKPGPLEVSLRAAWTWTVKMMPLMGLLWGIPEVTHRKHLAQFLTNDNNILNNLCFISDLYRFNFCIVISRGRSHCALALLSLSLEYFAHVYSEFIREKFNLSNHKLLKFKSRIPWSFFGILSFVKSN